MTEECSVREEVETQTLDSTSTAVTMSGWDKLYRSERKRERMIARRIRRRKTDQERMAVTLKQRKLVTLSVRDEKAAVAYERRRERAEMITRKMEDLQPRIVSETDRMKERDRKAFRKRMKTELYLDHEMAHRWRLKENQKQQNLKRKERMRTYARFAKPKGTEVKRSRSQSFVLPGTASTSAELCAGQGGIEQMNADTNIRDKSESATPASRYLDLQVRLQARKLRPWLYCSL